MAKTELKKYGSIELKGKKETGSSYLYVRTVQIDKKGNEINTEKKINVESKYIDPLKIWYTTKMLNSNITENMIDLCADLFDIRDDNGDSKIIVLIGEDNEGKMYSGFLTREFVTNSDLDLKNTHELFMKNIKEGEITFDIDIDEHDVMSVKYIGQTKDGNIYKNVEDDELTNS